MNKKMDEPDNSPTITVSLSRAIPVEQWGGKAEMFVSIGGITRDTTPEEMDAMLEQGNIAYSKLVPFLRERMKGRIKEAKGI